LLLKRAHTGGLGEETIETTSLSLDVFMALDRHVAPQLDVDHSGTHTRPDTARDVRQIALAIVGGGSEMTTKEKYDLWEKGWANRRWVARRLDQEAEEDDAHEVDDDDVFAAMLDDEDDVKMWEE